MKKINLILIALMALIFVSCSENETVMSIPEEANAVLFDTYTGRAPQTRGVEMTNEKLKTDHFGVLGYYTAQNTWEQAIAETEAKKATPNFMWNQQVTWKADTNWEYSPIKYWPTTQGDKVSFFAYAPYESAPAEGTNRGIVLSGNTETGNPTIKFTLQTDPENMVDLVTASVIDRGNKETTDTDGSNLKTPGKVNFQFKHALSRVNFIAKAADKTNNSNGIDDKTIINITDVKLDGGSDFYKSGTYTLSSTTTNGVWSFDDKTDKLTAAYNLANIVNKKAASHGAGDPMYVVPGIQVKNTHNVAKEGVSIFKDKEFLFLIPPTKGLAPKTAGSTESLATVTFTYDIVTADINLEKGYSITSATKTVALPAGTLEQGVAYNYTFTFNVDQVVVDASVTPWAEPTENGTEVDYTHDN